MSAQSFCNPAGNLVIISNYDGGPLNINVDMDIPNLKIGLSSYEPMVVTISGPYAANVTEIWYAGYNSNSNNNHCAIIPTTSISADAGTSVTIETYPPVTLFDPAGEPFMIYSYECSETPYSGNTPAQLVNYFSTNMGGVLLWHQSQYACYGSLNISGGGNCCLGACLIPIDAGQDLTICSGDSVALSAVGASTYSWSPTEFLSDPLADSPMAFPLETTTYVVVGTDAGGCSGVDTVMVNVLPSPPDPIITLLPGDTMRCDPEADFYFWFINGVLQPATGRYIWATMPGEYSVSIIVESCASSSEPLDFTPSPPPPSGLFVSGEGPVLVFPNPVSERLQVQWSTSFSPSAQWQLTDITGRILLSAPVRGDFSLDMSGFSEGLYHLRLQSETHSWMQPVVVAR